jgi:decaprenyl-phosphate phosphoribosyltransferase
LKRIAWIDVAALASGFALRVTAGAIAVGTAAPVLLLTATAAGAALLALGKRSAELALLGPAAGTHRRTLRMYRGQTLGRAVVVAEAITLLAFAAWTRTGGARALGIPLAAIATASLGVALDRYRQLVTGGEGGDPLRLLARDHWVVPALAVAATVVVLGRAVS